MNKFLPRGSAVGLAVILLAITVSENAAYKNNFTSKPWKLDAKYERSEVAFHTVEKPGTIIISTRQRYLYLVQQDDRAIRYGIGVDMEGGPDNPLGARAL
jgi:lipoprotein-anchoring transpeptidase ErfK/SrfK